MADNAGRDRHAPVRMMISYAHKDEKLRAGFEEHLSLLKNRGLVDVWKDRLIRAGGDWAHAIAQGMEAADIILLLVSPAFFASEYITGVELKRTLERSERGDVTIIPVIVREGDYTGWPFSHLRELPTDGLAKGRSVSGARWKNRDEAYRNVAEGIRSEVERIHGKRLERHAVNAYLTKRGVEPSVEDRAEIRGIGELFGRMVSGRSLLWVDDHPENNELERAALEGLGIRVETAVDTAGGLEALAKRPFDLVISDWVRSTGSKKVGPEGMRLLQLMRKQHIFVPLIFYAGRVSEAELSSRRTQAIQAGGSGVTASPRELLRWTIGELVRSVAFDPKAEFIETPLYPENG